MSDAVRADALLDEMPREGRGRLKVFLGAAPGVGKTYAMLQAAQAQLRQGVELRAGVVESHGRAARAADALQRVGPKDQFHPVDEKGIDGKSIA